MLIARRPSEGRARRGRPDGLPAVPRARSARVAPTRSTGRRARRTPDGSARHRSRQSPLTSRPPAAQQDDGQGEERKQKTGAIVAGWRDRAAAGAVARRGARTAARRSGTAAESRRATARRTACPRPAAVARTTRAHAAALPGCATATRSAGAACAALACATIADGARVAGRNAAVAAGSVIGRDMEEASRAAHHVLRSAGAVLLHDRQRGVGVDDVDHGRRVPSVASAPHEPGANTTVAVHGRRRLDEPARQRGVAPHAGVAVRNRGTFHLK